MARYRRFVLPVLFLALFVSLSACKRSPILEVEEVPLIVPAGVTEVQVAEAVKSAATSLGWRVSELDSGPLRAEFRSSGGKHRAVVIIKHSMTSLTIQHSTSLNLNYSIERSITYIHPRYNDWVAVLRDSIQRQVAGL